MGFVALVFAPHCRFGLRASVTTPSEDPPFLPLASDDSDKCIRYAKINQPRATNVTLISFVPHP